MIPLTEFPFQLNSTAKCKYIWQTQDAENLNMQIHLELES